MVWYFNIGRSNIHASGAASDLAAFLQAPYFPGPIRLGLAFHKVIIVSSTPVTDEV